MANSGNFPANPPDEDDGTIQTESSRWASKFSDSDMKDAYREAVVAVGFEERVREVTEYELDFGKYFWPRWVRYPLVRLFRLEGSDGLTRWERKRLAKKYAEKVFCPAPEETLARLCGMTPLRSTNPDQKMFLSDRDRALHYFYETVKLEARIKQLEAEREERSCPDGTPTSAQSASPLQGPEGSRVP